MVKRRLDGLRRSPVRGYLEILKDGDAFRDELGATRAERS